MTTRIIFTIGTCIALAGCTAEKPTPTASTPVVANSRDDAGKEVELDEVATERAKLDAPARALVDAQEWCVISSDERLGSMGAPIRLDIQGQAVYVCCKGCQKKAESNPEKTLAKLAELKAKKAKQVAETVKG